MTTRRHLLKAAAFGAGLAAAQTSPNDTINIAVVGFRGRGRDHYRAFAAIPGVRVAYLCDVDERLFPEAVAEVEKIGGYRPKTEFDIRELLKHDDIDAISIATPDHWHALMTIWACQAGKDVYVEKPCSYTLWEGRQMVRAARKYDRIVQVGLNRRSMPDVRSAVAYLRSGAFGDVYRSKAIVYRGRMNIGKVQESSIPKGVHWDLYVGPAPYRAFTTNRFHYGWHMFKDMSTHEVGNNGVHYLDVARWAMSKDTHPVRIHCAGGQFAEDSDSEVPNTQVGTFEYEDGTLSEIDATTLYSPTFGGTRMGNFFYTEKGYLSSVDGWKTTVGAFTPGDRPDMAGGVSMRASNLGFPKQTYVDGPEIPQLDEPEVSHFENFINCVRSRKRQDLFCEIEQGHLSTSLCHLTNIAYFTGRKLVFDPATETFPGDAEANKFLKREYREPFVVPENV
ncbi:MAG: Gfo/Idh/MocA family oxidoreductase [Bryobacterales bacterium]|nr:Gfo/Idh/MocA family oxidoreductase [Bryobacterales bacterium]